MGSGQSKAAPPAPLPPTPPPPPPPPSFPLDFTTAREDLEDKVPTAVAVGAVAGVARGYYVGDVAALYGYSAAFGLGMASTAFYGTAYLLRYARQREDLSNYTLSGSITGFWALAGLKRTLPAGLLGALVGAAVGTSVKVGGDWLYDTSREAWLSHRIHRLEFSRPRLLEKAHKPAFHPKDSRLQHQPAPAETKESLAPPLADKSGGAQEGANAKPKKGWLW